MLKKKLNIGVNGYKSPYWKSPEEYIEFAKLNDIYGAEALKLKKKLDKQADIGEPKIK